MPPPPVPVPFTYYGKLAGKRLLTDEQVAEARRCAAFYSVTVLAKVYNVPFNTMLRAIKGLSYKHLNHDYPPQR